MAADSTGRHFSCHRSADVDCLTKFSLGYYFVEGHGYFDPSALGFLKVVLELLPFLLFPLQLVVYRHLTFLGKGELVAPCPKVKKHELLFHLHIIQNIILYEIHNSTLFLHTIILYILPICVYVIKSPYYHFTHK